MRKPILAGVVVAGALLIAGTSWAVYAATSSDPAPTVAPTPSAIPTPSSTTPATPTVSAEADDQSSVEPLTPAEWDQASEASAIAAAETAMVAYARPDLSRDEWWAALEPLFEPNSVADYAYLQPAAIAATEVTGAGTLVDATSAYIATVEVPTDAGTYGVVLARTGGDAPWLVVRFDVPEAD